MHEGQSAPFVANNRQRDHQKQWGSWHNAGTAIGGGCCPRQSGVLVNALAPGHVATAMTLANNPPEALAEIAARIPLRRLAEPAEIADLVAFLASQRNSYMTGHVVVCDGGFTSV